ncbi:MAG TPA: OsmC family protein [Gemmatimonas sp.]|nr:OsmC family protein [Gemmatimonas sp.]
MSDAGNASTKATAPNAGPTTAPAAGKPPAHVQITWAGGHRFDGKRQGDFPSVRIDASGKTGPSPVDALLLALASCTAVDVVDILEKRRTPVSALDVKVTGERFNGVPGRITRIDLTYIVDGEGIERTHAERAIELAVTKYCSVRDSLDKSMPVEWTLVLNGA